MTRMLVASSTHCSSKLETVQMSALGWKNASSHSGTTKCQVTQQREQIQNCEVRHAVDSLKSNVKGTSQMQTNTCSAPDWQELHPVVGDTASGYRRG